MVQILLGPLGTSAQNYPLAIRSCDRETAVAVPRYGKDEVHCRLWWRLSTMLFRNNRFAEPFSFSGIKENTTCSTTFKMGKKKKVWVGYFLVLCLHIQYGGSVIHVFLFFWECAYYTFSLVYASSLVLNSSSVCEVHLLKGIVKNERRAPPGASTGELHRQVWDRINR